jgi:hypothetical protein
LIQICEMKEAEKEALEQKVFDLENLVSYYEAASAEGRSESPLFQEFSQQKQLKLLEIHELNLNKNINSLQIWKKKFVNIDGQISGNNTVQIMVKEMSMDKLIMIMIRVSLFLFG